MAQAHYDAWNQLRLLVMPTEGEDWPTIHPTDDPHMVDVQWPDGSGSMLHFRDGEWHFCGGREIAGYSHACGYHD